MFLIGAYTGLRYSDLVNVTESDIVDDFAEVTAIKTDKMTLIPFNHKVVKEIRLKHNGLPKAISNQKINKYIKIVCERVPQLHTTVSRTSTVGGVKLTTKSPKYKRIQTHTARRSFVSNLILQGIPPLDICQITGHSSEQMLLNYCKVKPRESISRIARFYDSTN